jgi:hypothetical protein
VLEESQGNFLGIGQLEEREEGPILKAKMVLQSLGYRQDHGANPVWKFSC